MRAPCILLVEADIVIRNPLGEYLRECGYRVLEAGTTSDARKLFDDAGLPIDIAMIDAGGENGDGFALSTWIRAERPDCDVILTGTLTKTVQKAGDLCEEGPSIAKPYDHSLVLDRIRRLLAVREKRAAKPKG
jgi:DNA-binding response OmpR family regulator